MIVKTDSGDFNFNNLKGTEFSAKKGDFIFQQGDEFKGVIYIKSGMIYVMSQSLVLWSAEEKELIGISTYYSGDTICRYSAKVGVDCTYILIAKEDFEKLQKHEMGVSFSRSLMNMMVNRLGHTNQRLIDLLGSSSKKRIIKEILRKSKQSESNNISITTKEISLLVSVSTRLINRILSELESQSLIFRTKKEIAILNHKGLLDIIG